MTAGDGDYLELAQVRRLASELAAADAGPAAELACALADVVLRVADRVDALWQLIAAVVSAADPATAGSGTAGSGTAGSGTAGNGTAGNGPPAEFLQALTSARGSGHAGIRLSLAGGEWVAAVSQDQRPADPAAAWAALERLAQSAGDQSAGDQGDTEDQGDR
jgi:hypothetical protein